MARHEALGPVHASPPAMLLTRESNNRRKRARSALGRWTVLGVTLFTTFLAQPYCGADAADVTADLAGVPSGTNLGLLAMECSKYCNAGVKGLDLWLSLEEECISMDNVALLRHRLGHGKALLSSSPSSPLPGSPDGEMTTLISVDSARAETETATGKAGWSLLFSVLLCAMAAIPGLFVGFRKGSRLAKHVPTVATGAFCSLP